MLVGVSTVVVVAITVMLAVSPQAMSSDVQRLGQPVVWRPAQSLAPAALPVILACVAACLAVAVRRLVRAASPEREQLGWYLLITVAFFVCSVWLPPLTDAVVQPLLILALGWALLWYGLVDLRLALRRTLVYGVLTVCVAVVYAVVTGVLSAHVPAGPLPALVAAAVVAVGLIPFRDLMQRGAERLVYAHRRDPAQAVARVGEGLRRAGGPLPASSTVHTPASMPTLVARSACMTSTAPGSDRFTEA